MRVLGAEMQQHCKRDFARSRGPSNCRFSTLSAGVDLLEDATEVRVNGVRLCQNCKHIKLLGMAIHLHSAIATHHLGCFYHTPSH
jgi:hypothetical protein